MLFKWWWGERNMSPPPKKKREMFHSVDVSTNAVQYSAKKLDL